MAVQRHQVTLIELIAAVVLMGLLGALVAPYVGGVLRRTAEPVLQARAEAALVQVAERISSDYERDASLAANLALFADRIVNRTVNYGSYDTAVCTYVKIDSGAEVAGTQTDILKVTLANKGAVLVLLLPYRVWPP